MENEKVENIWSTEEKKNREGKGENILRRKRRKIFGPQRERWTIFGKGKGGKYLE